MKHFQTKILKAFFLFFILAFSFNMAAAQAEDVYFNVSTHKVHKMSCHSGKCCTKNCIIVPRERAYKIGGVPCKNCGG